MVLFIFRIWRIRRRIGVESTSPSDETRGLRDKRPLFIP